MSASPALVLLPGMDGTGRLFGRLRDALPDELDTLVVEYPTDKLRSHRDLVELVRERLPHDRPFALVAESFSGPLAIELSASPPDGLVGLALCASFAANPLPRSFRRLSSLAKRAAVRVPPPRGFVRVLMTGRDVPDELVDDVVAAISSVDPNVIAERMHRALTLDVTGLLGRIAVPMLYLAGTRDRLVGLRGMRRIAPHVPQLVSVAIDGPHLLAQARAGRVAEELVAFLASLAPEPSPPR